MTVVDETRASGVRQCSGMSPALAREHASRHPRRVRIESSQRECSPGEGIIL